MLNSVEYLLNLRTSTDFFDRNWVWLEKKTFSEGGGVKGRHLQNRFVNQLEKSSKESTQGCNTLDL